MKEIIKGLAQSRMHKGGIVYTTSELLDWIKNRNADLTVKINKIPLSECEPWFYDETDGIIRNTSRSFFEVSGFSRNMGGSLCSEPIILQKEIGYLGIICKKIDGVLHLLMQAKIEPGNINKIQISPTIQATKSNFTAAHGGKTPAYLECFLNATPDNIIYDQIQSEQSSRFLGKRNRNIMIYIEDDIEILPSHRWMTLGQINELMRYDNLVNMDTRTVLSGIPYYKLQSEELREIFSGEQFLNDAVSSNKTDCKTEIYNYVNNYKMLYDNPPELSRLNELKSWEMGEYEIKCCEDYPFKVVFCDIEIEGREVRRWKQPLFEAQGIATFGLLAAEIKGELKFLIKARAEAGCFDSIELGPTVQREAVGGDTPDIIEQIFEDALKDKQNIIFDGLLSEEGGRFYHEQNRNVIIKLASADFSLPKGYFWVDFLTLNELISYNNILNIQLRNLLSLL